MREADYVVVGAGAAGAVVAARLSEDRDVSVLVLEAGGKGRGPLFSVPLMTGVLLRSTIANWSYVTEPEAELNGRMIRWPRGKALGGSTAINGMVYMRGLPSDYDRWAQSGLQAGTGRPCCLPSGRARIIPPETRPSTVAAVRWRVSRRPLGHPLFQAFLDGAAAAGHPRTHDFNGLRRKAPVPTILQSLMDDVSAPHARSWILRACVRTFRS